VSFALAGDEDAAAVSYDSSIADADAAAEAVALALRGIARSPPSRAASYEYSMQLFLCLLTKISFLESVPPENASSNSVHAVKLEQMHVQFLEGGSRPATHRRAPTTPKAREASARKPLMRCGGQIYSACRITLHILIFDDLLYSRIAYL
jgi:hypothetical protein